MTDDFEMVDVDDDEIDNAPEFADGQNIPSSNQSRIVLRRK